MDKLHLTMACGEYDRTHALQTGAVEAEGIRLNYIPLEAGMSIGMLLISVASDSSGLMPCNLLRSWWMACVMGVSTKPGHTALTVMPCGASASAAERTTLITPALLAA